MNGAVKSAARAIDVLVLLAAHPEGLALTEIADKLRIARSSAHGLMGTLVDRKVVVSRQDPGRTSYRLGPKIFEIGQAYVQSTDLLRDGQEAVRDLSLATGETVHLATLDDLDVVYLAKHEAQHAVRMVSVVGQRIPAHSTAVGKVLLAALTDEQLNESFRGVRLSQVTQATITRGEDLLRELKLVRQHGWATEREESTVGVGCVAAPVLDDTGTVAGLSVSVPLSRLPEERIPELVAKVVTAASGLSRVLGAGTPSIDRPLS